MNRRSTYRAEDIAAQAAALAAHLQRSGLPWLPKPDLDRVQELTAELRPREANQEAHEPTVTEDGLSSAAAETGPTRAPTMLESPTSPVDPLPVDPLPVARPETRLDSIAPVSSESTSYPSMELPLADRQAALEEISAEVRTCTRCEVLSSCRTNTVFGEGSSAPRFAFFGEGPGADEDRSGRPFVGRAGQLLTKMIEACTLKREDVYILNTVKCRPPGNRNPELDEISNCRPFYARQLDVLRPEYIVCLGAISSQELLNSKLSVGRLRGKLHRYHGSKVLVTYHPAYLLRNPSAKKAAWQDLQLMLQDAGIVIPQVSR